MCYYRESNIRDNSGAQDRIRTYILLPVTFGSVRSGEGYLGMERIARIELASSAWKAVIIPLYDIRIKLIYTGDSYGT